MIFIKTSNSDEPDWVLSAYGVATRIEEIAKEAGIEVYSVTPHHSNLPTTFVVSSSHGIDTIRISATTAAEVEDQICAGLGIAKKAAPVPEVVVEVTLPLVVEEPIAAESKKEVGDGSSRVSHRRGGGN